MHFIVHDVTGGPEVHWIDDFIVAILFITIKIFRLTSMAYRPVRQCNSNLSKSGHRTICAHIPE